MEHIRVLGYIRVSCEEQVREGVSMDAQADKIRAYCSLHDMDLIDIEEDAGISGKSTKNREGLNRCMERLRDGEAESLVIHKLDRLSRSTRDVLEISDLFQKNQWALHSICEKLDTSSASGRFVLTILAALAQMEREQIGERTSLALQHKKAKGERLGTTPLGFETVETSEGKELIPVQEELSIIKRVCDLRTEGKTLRAIAEVMNHNRVPTKRGGKWHQSTVRSILTRVVPRIDRSLLT